MGTATAQYDPALLDMLRQTEAEAMGLLAPPRKVTISQHAEENQVLAKGTSSKPGPWRTQPYQREMMDAVLATDVREAIYFTCTQIGKSSILNNIIGYFIDMDPRPIMMVQPTDMTAKAYSKKRISTMISSSEALNKKVRDPKGRRPGNTILLKEFDGGFLKIAGANAAAGLRSDPIAVLLLDEVDGYPDDVDGEGDPVELATRRTDTFPDALIVKASTPGKPRGFSRIESDYKRSDQRRAFVPCPHCGHYQPFVWRDPKSGLHRLQWEKDKDGKPKPATVRYICELCDRGIEERYKRRMLQQVRWEAAHPERRSVIGFHINALYMPWRLNWHELAQEWTDAQDNPEKLKAFVTLRLAETWDEQGQSVDAHTLAPRLEKYKAEVPNGIGVLVATADTQLNRIEAQIVGFGAGEESWLIAHEVFWGDPSVQTDPSTGVDVWAQLDSFLLKEWRHESGVMMRPAMALIDSGNNADAIYDYVLPRQFTTRLVFACKGVEYISKPGLAQEGTTKRQHVRLWVIATAVTKDRLYARLKIPVAGPGYSHLPDWTTDEYLQQLTSEKKVAMRDKRTRRTKRHWVQSYPRNEALDMTVYSHGALFVLQHFVEPRKYLDLGRLAEQLRNGEDPYKPVSSERRVRPLAIGGGVE